MAGKFEVYEDSSGKFRFRLKAGNGEVVATGQAYEAVAAIKDAPHLDFRGLHSHIGSQIFGTEAFAEAARIVIDFAAVVRDELSLDVPAFDLGGGVGIAYTGQDPVPTSPVEVARLRRW